MRETEQLRVFHTGDHVCGYFPERIARDLVIDPARPAPGAGLPGRAGLGFRRSGGIVYRPHCRGCRACVAVRIPVAGFRPGRGQRAAASRATPTWWRGCCRPNAATNTSPCTSATCSAPSRRRRGRARRRREFDQFLVGSWSDGRFSEFAKAPATDCSRSRSPTSCPTRCRGLHLLRPDGRSARARHLAILKQLEWARATAAATLYLGYWIAGTTRWTTSAGSRRWKASTGGNGNGWNSPLERCGRGWRLRRVARRGRPPPRGRRFWLRSPARPRPVQHRRFAARGSRIRCRRARTRSCAHVAGHHQVSATFCPAWSGPRGHLDEGAAGIHLAAGHVRPERAILQVGLDRLAQRLERVGRKEHGVTGLSFIG